MRASRTATGSLGAAAAVWACGGAPEPQTLGATASAIVRGIPSGDDQNAVVLLVRGSFLSWCTAAVVAPEMLLTARHCLFDADLGENQYAFCDDGARVQVSRALPPESFAVYVGNERPLAEPVAHGVETYSSPDLDLCANDIALLRVDVPLPIEPLPMRLDTPPVKGEVGTLVGWGATMEHEQLPDKRQQRELIINELGPLNYAPPGGPPRFIDGYSFAATEGGCPGDSGGPLIAKETGAIIGMQHAITSLDPVVELEVENAWAQCFSATTLFQRLDQQASWMRERFREAQAAPWLEGQAAPAAIAAPCGSPDECLSGLCLDVSGTSFCSMRCDGVDCPADMSCVGPVGGRSCVPAALAASESAPASACALRAASRSSLGLLVLALVSCCARRSSVKRAKKGDTPCNT